MGSLYELCKVVQLQTMDGKEKPMFDVKMVYVHWHLLWSEDRSSRPSTTAPRVVIPRIMDNESGVWHASSHFQ